jgi:hypothetical protein
MGRFVRTLGGEEGVEWNIRPALQPAALYLLSGAVLKD